MKTINGITAAGVLTDNSGSVVQGSGGTANETINGISSGNLTVETDLQTSAAVTPGDADNLLIIVGAFCGLKFTNTGTITFRIKEGVATLASSTSGSLAAAAGFGVTLIHTSTDISVAAHTYKVTAEPSTAGFKWSHAGIKVDLVSLV